MVVVPPVSTGSPATEAPVLPTHIDHLISQEDIEALQDLNKLSHITSSRLQPRR